MIRLIVGLGNPGKRYESTRHNAGAWVIEALCKEQNVTLQPKSAFHAQYTQLSLTTSLKLHLAIPTTFMNESGYAVGAIARCYKIAPQEILIIHDELDFMPGVVKFKLGGGLGGHNGLKDIVRVVGSHDFWRLRLGIGHPGDRDKVVKYVLDAPLRGEYQHIKEAMQSALEVLPDICHGQTERAMQILHSK